MMVSTKRRWLKETVGGVLQNGMLGASHGAKDSLQHDDEDS